MSSNPTNTSTAIEDLSFVFLASEGFPAASEPSKSADETGFATQATNTTATAATVEAVSTQTTVVEAAEKALLDYALDEVRKGHYVFPCYPRSKSPAGEVVPNGVKNASNDEAVVRMWWARNPEYNPAIALGPSQLVVWDFDTVPPFENQPPTFTVKTGRIPVNGIDGIQRYFHGSSQTRGFKAGLDPVEKNGGGEIRSRGAYVMAAGAVHPSGNRYVVIHDLPLAESPEQNVAPSPGPAITDEELSTYADYIEGAFELSGIDYERRERMLNDEGVKWQIVCPWAEEHTTIKNTGSAVILWASGKRIYTCHHGHCRGIREWKQLREWMEEKIGMRLPFADPLESIPVILNGELYGAASTTEATPIPNAAPNATPASTQDAIKKSPTGATPLPMTSLEDEDEDSEAARQRRALEPFKDVPPFDPSVMTGVCRDAVELATRGTTLVPQYIFTSVKTIIGALMMAQGVKFDLNDGEPPRYVANMGYTGTGKGEALQRIIKMLFPTGLTRPMLRLKFIESIDSAPGLKDFFFEEPEDAPVLGFIDEIATLTHKSSDQRDPVILDVVGELANKTTVTRTLVRRNGGARQKDGCRLILIMCGPDGEEFMQLAAGRTSKGLMDRIIPEYAEPVVPGNLPLIPFEDAVTLLEKIKALPYLNGKGKPNTMQLSAEAQALISKFWAAQPSWLSRKVRFKKSLIDDAYVTAFVDSRLTVTKPDVEIAVKVFVRQMAIRKAAFSQPSSNRVSYFTGGLKRLTEDMDKKLKKGQKPELVALSRRDFANQLGAYEGNEIVEFNRAWDAWLKGEYLAKSTVKAANGQSYQKWLPNPHQK